jgi:DNA polymerase-3 subunit gamma/tau
MRTNHQNLAITYRPKTFEEVCGQQIAVKILKKVVENRSFKHCYLFAGDSGCGKTTLARIFANAINNGLGTPEEIDAASFGGVDNVRAIIEAGRQRAVDAEYKIFIIDECHSITSAGWQAYLKSLEEPAPYTIYIFCTTEPNKIPETVLNRMQRYNITKVDSQEIYERLVYICKNEGFTNYEAACDLISKTSQGCMRDAIMKLDQCADFDTELSVDNVKQVLSVMSFEAMFILANALYTRDIDTVLYVIDKLYNSGADLKSFIELFLEFALDLSKYSIFKTMNVVNIPVYLEGNVKGITEAIEDRAWYAKLIDAVLNIKLEIKYDSSYKSTIEALLLRFCKA